MGQVAPSRDKNYKMLHFVSGTACPKSCSSSYFVAGYAQETKSTDSAAANGAGTGGSKSTTGIIVTPRTDAHSVPPRTAIDRIGTGTSDSPGSVSISRSGTL
jgi:alkaline phosphatase